MRTMTRTTLTTLAAGAMVATGTLGVLPAGATTEPTCPTGSWPAATEGRPAAHLDAEGVYVWHTSRGWRLRVNEPGADRAVFSGSIRTDGAIVGIGRHLEQGGEGTVSIPSAGVVGFRFVNYGGVDGLNFGTRCASQLRINVKMNGEPVPVHHIYIGADGVHPDAVPFTFTKA